MVKPIGGAMMNDLGTTYFWVMKMAIQLGEMLSKLNVQKLGMIRKDFMEVHVISDQLILVRNISEKVNNNY